MNNQSDRIKKEFNDAEMKTLATDGGLTPSMKCVLESAASLRRYGLNDVPRSFASILDRASDGTRNVPTRLDRRAMKALVDAGLVHMLDSGMHTAYVLPRKDGIEGVIEAFLEKRKAHISALECSIARKLHEARLLANGEAGQRLPTDNVWLAEARGLLTTSNSEIRYRLPGADNWRRCKTNVELTWDEWEHYMRLRNKD